jgi:hypothetical protein
VHERPTDVAQKPIYGPSHAYTMIHEII